MKQLCTRECSLICLIALFFKGIKAIVGSEGFADFDKIRKLVHILEKI